MLKKLQSTAPKLLHNSNYMKKTTNLPENLKYYTSTHLIDTLDTNSDTEDVSHSSPLFSAFYESDLTSQATTPAPHTDYADEQPLDLKT